MLEPKRRVTGRLVLGMVVMALGVLWTLDNLGMIESEPIIQWWPLVLVAIGTAKLLGVGTARHTVWGATFVIAGLLMLGNVFDVLDVHLFQLWPLVLIAIGFHLLSRSRAPASDDPSEEPSSVIHTFAFWSGVGRKVVSQAFRGGDVTAVMGGAEIDLRKAKPIPGNAVLDVFVWWGGVDLFVPENWKVVNEATVIMGGIEDKAKEAPSDSRDIVILRGLVLMGGVDIKN